MSLKPKLFTRLILVFVILGKMHKEHLGKWLRDCFFEHIVVGDEAVLVVDSWPAFTNLTFIESYVPVGFDLHVRVIPPGVTSLAQPLDVYGFRLWKSYLRHMSDVIVLENLDCNLHLRDNILKIQSLIHNQFSCPRFRETLRYGWYKAGYFEHDLDDFYTPFQCCFESEAALRNDKCAHCDKRHFITCSWCKETLCFDHFFKQFHYCHWVN